MIAKNNQTGIESSVVAGWSKRRVSIKVEPQGFYYVTVTVFDTCRQNYTSETVLANRSSLVEHPATMEPHFSTMLSTPGDMHMTSRIFPPETSQCVTREEDESGIISYSYKYSLKAIRGYIQNVKLVRTISDVSSIANIVCVYY